MTDTTSHDWKMQCLARELLRLYPQHSAYGRRDLKAWLGRFAKRHGNLAKAQVQHYLRKEFLKQGSESQGKLYGDAA